MGVKSTANTSLNDWDEEALLILLNVIHPQNSKLPKTMNIELLAKVAELVDFFECLEATSPCVKLWIDEPNL